MGSHRMDTSGYTLLELMIIVGLIGMLAVIALPNILKARVRVQQQVCIENLGQIESAKQIWGLENGKNEGDAPTQSELIGPDLYIKEMPICPGSGTYSFNPIGQTAVCSIAGHTL